MMVGAKKSKAKRGASTHLACIFLTLILLLLAACGLRTATPLATDTSEPGKAFAVKVLVSQRGMVELGASELQAMGAALDNLAAGQLSLTWRGQAVSFWLHGEGRQRTLRFWGEPSQSIYSATNIYWLNYDPQRSGSSPDAPGQLDPVSLEVMTAYTATQRLEENKIYQPMGADGEHWFWLSLPAPRQQAFPVELKDLGPEGGKITLAAWSSNSAPVSPDHHLRVMVNGKVVIDQTWDGAGRQKLEGSIPAGVLKEGANEILVEAPGDTGAPADINFIDWLELSYSRLPKATNDALEFFVPGGSLELTGFSGLVAVYDITDPLRAVLLGTIQAKDNRWPFQGEQGQRYLAVGPKGVIRADALEQPQQMPDLKLPLGAKYIAIGADELLPALQPLLDLRQSQGLTVRAIPLQAVYDQFNHGFPEPEAVRSFLAYAARDFELEYVLLVGDSTYDPRGYLGKPDGSQFPTFYVDTYFGGQTASDYAFADLDGDGQANLALGRLPASQASQVTHYVEKVLAYEKQPEPLAWNRRVLAVADGQEASFAGDAQSFLGQLPAEYQSQLFNPAPGDEAAAQQIAQDVNEGFAMVAYFGHGSINMWGKDKLLTAEQAGQFVNANLPVFMTMTCLNGYFIHPKLESLAEALLWAEKGGAVAVLAPSSLTTAGEQAELRIPFVDALIAEKNSLGKALLQAQRSITGDGKRLSDFVQTFMLLGDPALKLK